MTAPYEIIATYVSHALSSIGPRRIEAAVIAATDTPAKVRVAVAVVIRGGCSL